MVTCAMLVVWQTFRGLHDYGEEAGTHIGCKRITNGCPFKTEVSF